MEFEMWLVERLKARGFYKLNDVNPRALIDALKAFQKANDLTQTGTADDVTVHELRKDVGGAGSSQFQLGPAKPADPIWMREARRQMGILEVPGPKSNPTILGWAKALGGWVASFYKDDDTPWCGLFAAHCIGLTLPAEKLPTNYLSALAWADFGIECEPAIGAILAFRRDGGGHVGFYAGENADSYVVLGGNQGNSVKLSNVEKRRCVGIRWPKTGGAQIGGRVNAIASGGLSRNEA
ncbi:TIGR02594 family protein [Rhizobium leguminosarum]|nr:TIGR02594 family protein [Rhizobium leguminosarum]